MFVILDLTSFNSDRRGTLENTAKHIALKSQSSLNIHLTYLFVYFFDSRPLSLRNEFRALSTLLISIDFLCHLPLVKLFPTKAKKATSCTNYSFSSLIKLLTF